ncbi:hypothetical protein [Panacagrimonas sp.]|uniref:hypothetical protein n=1 Tax=Panacagrimonas sp. TaxID=2480088 RepID=UPI003B51D5A1
MSESSYGVVLDAFPSDEETISPSEYMRRHSEDAMSVRGALFQPPRFGQKGFGTFVLRGHRRLFEVAPIVRQQRR